MRIFLLVSIILLTFSGVTYGNKLTIVTTDGSVINVPMLPQYTNIVVRVRTDYGELNMNITSIQKILLVTNNIHSIHTLKGEILQGTITSPNIVLPTRYGNLTIPPSEVGKLVVTMTNISFSR